MTDNRMQAKLIPGEHCHFCGDTSAPLIKTPCCHHWICCDTDFVSLRGGGQCQYGHERFTLCYSHYSDKHSGPWQTCQVCKKFWSKDAYEEYSAYSIPRFEEGIPE